MLRYPEIKNNPSAEYGQSTTEDILNRLALFLYEFFWVVLHICYGFGTMGLCEKGTLEERKKGRDGAKPP